MVTKPFVYEEHGIITVPPFFRTDFASIPRGLRWLVTGHNKTRKPAVIHDYLYHFGIGKRKEADQIFRTALEEEGVPRWKRNLCYWAVRAFGGLSWQGK